MPGRKPLPVEPARFVHSTSGPSPTPRTPRLGPLSQFCPRGSQLVPITEGHPALDPAAEQSPLVVQVPKPVTAGFQHAGKASPVQGEAPARVLRVPEAEGSNYKSRLVLPSG